MIGGVCGGLGRYVGIDPIIFRIVLAALAIFGGVGLLLYALAWLLIPEDGTDVSELQRLFQGHPSPAPVIAAIVVGVIGVITVTEIAYHRRGRFEVLLILLAVVAVDRDDQSSRAACRRPPRRSRRLPYGTPPRPPFVTTPAFIRNASAAELRQRRAPTAGCRRQHPNAVRDTSIQRPSIRRPAIRRPSIQLRPQYSAPRYTAPLGPPAGFSPSRPVYTPPLDTCHHRRSRQSDPPSFLGPIASASASSSSACCSRSTLRTRSTLSAQAIFATSLLIVGLALVVGTWIGRARVLIAFGAVLAIALVVDCRGRRPVAGRHR